MQNFFNRSERSVLLISLNWSKLYLVGNFAGNLVASKF